MNFRFPSALVIVQPPRRKYAPVIANFRGCVLETPEYFQTWADVVSLAKRRGLKVLEGTCRIYIDVPKAGGEKLAAELVAIMARCVRAELAVAYLDKELNVTKSVPLGGQ